MGNNDSGGTRCENCLSYTESGSRFCSQCGAPIASAEGRPPSAYGRGSLSLASLFARGVILLVLAAAGTYGGILLYRYVDPQFLSPSGADESPQVEKSFEPEPTIESQPADRGDTPSEIEVTLKGRTVSLTPDALLAAVGPSVAVFVGMNQKGVEFSRSAAAEIGPGLALPAASLKGSYLGWIVLDSGEGREAKSVTYFDEMLGGALLDSDGERARLRLRDPAELNVGARLFQVRPGDRGQAGAILPGRYAGKSYAPDTGAIRHLFTGAPPTSLGAVIVDDQGHFLGIAAPGQSDDPFHFIPSIFFEPGPRRGSMTLTDLNAIYFEGSFEALVREARSRLKLGSLAEALDLFDQARARNPFRGHALDQEVLNITLNLADELTKGGAPRQALDLCTRKSTEFSFSADLMLLAFRAAAQTQEYGAASGWILKVEPLDPELYDRLQGEHVALYLAWSGSLVHGEQRRDALGVLREGLRYRPWSASLNETLGNLLKSLRDYRAAASAFQEASRLDPERVAHLAGTIELCLELQGQPGSVAINFDPDDPIFCRGLVDGKVWVDFIVDTGASITSIPRSAAEQLGINVKHVNRRAHITTAGGEIEVPYISVQTLDVGGLVVKQPHILIHDLPKSNAGLGLLGLNFLDKFVYKIDHQSGRMTIRPR